jgi:hypothetical protein
MEVQVTQAMYFQGKPVSPGEVIDLPPADAQYLIGIGRVESIDEVVAKPMEIKPVKRTKAKSQESEA